MKYALQTTLGMFIVYAALKAFGYDDTLSFDNLAALVLLYVGMALQAHAWHRWRDKPPTDAGPTIGQADELFRFSPVPERVLQFTPTPKWCYHQQSECRHNCEVNKCNELVNTVERARIDQ